MQSAQQAWLKGGSIRTDIPSVLVLVCLTITVSALLHVPGAEAATGCIRAGFAISHTVKHKATGIIEGAVGGVSYEQQRANGAIRILTSSVGFANGTKTRVDIQGQGTASDFSLRGNITRVPKAATVVGDFTLQGVPGRGNVPVHLEIAARGLVKVGETTVKGQSSTVLQGKTSYILTDLETGAILSQGKPGKLSTLRTFRYQWSQSNCGGGTKR